MPVTPFTTRSGRNTLSPMLRGPSKYACVCISQRPGIMYIPFASMTCPRRGLVAGDGPTLAMRLPSTTTVIPRRSVPSDTSTIVVFVKVSVWAATRTLATASMSRTRSSNPRIMSSPRRVRRESGGSQEYEPRRTRATSVARQILIMPITLDDLRRFAVARSLFKPTTLRRALDRMGFVQADPIRAPARAQDLTLRHRVKDYRAGDLERLYPTLDVEEDFFL